MTRRLRHEILPNVRAGWRSLDPGRMVIYVVSAMFVVGGGMALVANALSADMMGPRYHALYSWMTVAIGLAGLLLPWDRISPRWRMVFPFSAILLTSLAAAGDGQRLGTLLALYPMTFVLAGFTMPPGGSLMLAPPAGLILLWTSPNSEFTSLPSMAILLPMSVLVGEAVAQLMRRQVLNERRVAQMLDAVRVMARAEDETRGAQLLAVSCGDLIDLDAVTVLVTDPRRLGVLAPQAWHGDAALADQAPTTLPIAELTSVVTDEPVAFFAEGDLGRLGSLGRAPARSAVTLTLIDRAGTIVGLVVGAWLAPRWSFSGRDRQAADLLAQEGARMVERQHAMQELAREAQTDPLTELANRRTFSRALDTLQPGDAVVIVDLDHFKTVNDRFGHDVGDETLRDFARLLQVVARQVDTVARYGGEEFALVLADAGTAGAQVVMSRLRALWADRNPPATFSAGIAIHEPQRSRLATMRAADRAMYAAKDAGRDCVRLADEAMSVA